MILTKRGKLLEPRPKRELVAEIERLNRIVATAIILLTPYSEVEADKLSIDFHRTESKV